MEIDESTLALLPDIVTCISSDTLESLSSACGGLGRVIDQLGVESARAQGLYGPITSFYKFVSARPAQRLYILRTPIDESTGQAVVLGLLKVGQKHLFLTDRRAARIEVNALCVLDFYVSQEHQRCGYGSRLFRHMLQCENVEAEELAFDRPSLKFLALLSKNFDLRDYAPQNNSFVVFEQSPLWNVRPGRRESGGTVRRWDADGRSTAIPKHAMRAFIDRPFATHFELTRDNIQRNATVESMKWKRESITTFLPPLASKSTGGSQADAVRIGPFCTWIPSDPAINRRIRNKY